MDILGQSALIVAVTALSLALTSLSRNLRNKLVLYYALLCSVVSAWAFCFFLEKIFHTATLYRFHLVFNLALAPVGLHFLRVLTRVNTWFSRWLYRISVVYFVGTTSLIWSHLVHRAWVRSFAYFGPSFLFVACLHLMWVDWQLKSSAPRKSRASTVGFSRRTWIYLGALVLLCTAAMDHVPRLGDVVPSLGNILLCLYLFVISEAIIHQRLLNVSALFNRVIVFAVMSFCITLVYAVLVGWIEHSPALFFLNTLLASFITLLLLDPIRRLTQMGVLRLFSYQYLGFERKVEEAEMQLTGVLDTVGLAQLSLVFLENALKCESATVFVLRSDGTKFRRIRGLRDDALSNREVLVNHPVLDFLDKLRKRGETPVLLDQYLVNEIDRSTSQLQRQNYELVLKGLQALQANIAIPYISGSSILGFVALKVSNPPEPWGNNWGVLSAIYPFFSQAARTLKNMDVYVRLREKDRLAALGEMAAGLAHEIRNPLGAIKGAAQYLEPQGDSPQAAFLQVIVEEVNRLNKVVTQFLDYSRPFQQELSPYDVGSIIERTHALFLSARGTGQVDCALELHAPKNGFSALPKVNCVPEQIKQVLVNLVQNSLQAVSEAHPGGGGRIQLGATLGHRPRDNALEVILYVEDNGKGIARENIDKIFIPFFTTSPSGTGLGLPICSRIIENHGGRIDVASEEAKFTRFSVHLPVSELGGSR